MGRKPKVVVWTAGQEHSGKRKLVIGGVGLCLVLVVAGWFLLRPNASNDTKEPTVPEHVAREQIRDASRSLAVGDTDAVLRETDEALKQNIDVKQRVALLQQRAGAYQQRGDMDNLLATYKECERLEGSDLSLATAQGLSHVYSEKGDKVKAAHYLRKLITATDKTNDPVAESSIPTYRQMIRDLGEQP